MIGALHPFVTLRALYCLHRTSIGSTYILFTKMDILVIPYIFLNMGLFLFVGNTNVKAYPNGQMHFRTFSVLITLSIYNL